MVGEEDGAVVLLLAEDLALEFEEASRFAQSGGGEIFGIDAGGGIAGQLFAIERRGAADFGARPHVAEGIAAETFDHFADQPLATVFRCLAGKYGRRGERQRERSAGHGFFESCSAVRP